MAGESEIIEISLLSGTSDRPAITFTPGTPANPVSVGTAGQWIVSGEGVNPVHLYLVFDGRSVHVAAASPSAHALLAGMPVGADWARAPVPCELRFGGACVIMRYVPRVSAAEQEEQTVHDGGALWHAAQQAVKDAIDKARQGPPPDTSPLGVQFPPARPAAGTPADLGSTVPMGDQQAFREAVAKATSSKPPPPEEVTTVRAPLVGGPAPPAPMPAQEITMIAPQHMMLRPQVQAPPPPGGFGYPPLAPAPPAASPGGGTSPTANSTADGEKSVSGAKAYWQSASAVKKATLILMPFALVVSYFMLQPEAPAPPPKIIPAGTTAARHAAALRDGGSVGDAGADAGVEGADAGEETPADAATGATAATATPSPDNRPEAPPRAPPLPRGQRTPERLALDAVAAGSFDEAARLYTNLAATHPDDPSYKEAARILREKSGQPRATP
jgi:hypothetical protein